MYIEIFNEVMFICGDIIISVSCVLPNMEVILLLTLVDVM